MDARLTSYAQVGFKLLFIDLPMSLLMFLAWAVGESVARERWGDRLASFEALLRRDPINATVGRSVMRGLLTAPAVAASAFAIAAVPLFLHFAYPDLGSGTQYVLWEFSRVAWLHVLDQHFERSRLVITNAPQRRQRRSDEAYQPRVDDDFPSCAVVEIRNARLPIEGEQEYNNKADKRRCH